MKTEISREAFRPRRRYSGVFQQQGRVISDADWNELVEILRNALTSSLGDVVAEGTPRLGGVVGADGTIRWGRAYADGVPAELRPVPGQEASTDVWGQQADFPGAPSPPAGSVAYLDVWERSVSALEDGALLDPALHGADTTTRTQTMAQLKWCAPGSPPACDDARNPQKGNAVLTATLRTGTSEVDPCDPCADEISADDAAIGNYLFRVEVHDVAGPANAPTAIVLKWSGENGAQAHPKDRLPAGFGAGGWVYELYDHRAEKHLGVHLTGTAPVRGSLQTSLPATIGPQWTHVRRWDGYCRLTSTAGTWTVAEGVDRGIALTSRTPLDTAHGSFTIDAASPPRLAANLRTLQVTIDMAGKQLVAGDYWLAVVRERDTVTPVAVASPTPYGITHHYLKLGPLAGGKVTLDHESRRRFAFPPLTDIEARDVEYTTACANGLFTGVKTVQDALAALCNLGANHVAFDDVCPNGLFTGVTTVEGALRALCDLGANHVAFDEACANGLFAGVTTVEGALQALCNLGAHQVSFDGVCDNGLFTGADTVQEALLALCGLTAEQVSYTGPEDCELGAEDDTVAAALDALCRREAQMEDFCDDLLRLFGWGVLCGLVPELDAVQRPSGAGAEMISFVVRTTPGTFLSSRGCMVEAPELETEALIRGYGRTWKPWVANEDFATAIATELDLLRKGQLAPRGTDVLDSRRRRMITDKRMADLVTAFGRGEIAGGPELEHTVAEITGIKDVVVVEEIAGLVNEAGESWFTGGYSYEPMDGTLWLYVVDDDEGLRLELRPERPAPIVALPRELEAAYDQPEALSIGEGANCDRAHADAWRPYSQVTCPEPRDGAVCLGVVGAYGTGVWVCPDDREQLFPSPAYQAAHWMTHRASLYDDMKESCTWQR